jgi:DNA (cytosine-5)-methyltransferase 1
MKKALASDRLRKTEKNKTAVDLFAGAGGISLGLHDAGYEVRLASDFDPACSRTYRTNFPSTRFIEGDIRSISSQEFLDEVRLKPRTLDLLIGGPPCQGFSIIGAREVDDPRNNLFREFLRVGEVLKPRCMVVENVLGLATLANGSILQAILHSIEAMGYTASFAELLAAQYGAPQMRWRMVIIAFRNDIGLLRGMGFPIPTRGHRPIGSLIPNCTITKAESAGFVTTREAIGDLPSIESGCETSVYTGEPRCEYQQRMRRGLTDELHNHYAPRMSPQNLARINALTEGQDWRDLPNELLPEGMKRALRKDHTRRYSRMTWEGVPRSIITRFRDPKSGEYTHPAQQRTISIREAARIQSFPDSFIFAGSYSEQYDQVGNAVPPLLAEAVGKEVAACLDGTATHRLSNAFSRRPSLSQTSLALDAL